MLGRKLHLEMVNEFHDRIETVRNELKVLKTKYGDDYEKWDEDVKSKIYVLTSEYFELTSQLWGEMDDFLEYKIKHRLYILKNEPYENWNQD